MSGRGYAPCGCLTYDDGRRSVVETYCATHDQDRWVEFMFGGPVELFDAVDKAAVDAGLSRQEYVLKLLRIAVGMPE